MFTYPLAAVVTAYYLTNGTIDRRRLIVYVGLTLTFVVIIKLTLYTIW
ncbi:hypothetical protein [Chloroflexus sp.]